jgi:hypothetical protein
MPGDIERFRTPRDARDKETPGFVYRAIRFDAGKKKNVLISNHQESGISGKTDGTTIEFDDPKVLELAISVLEKYGGSAHLKARATITKFHDEWDHSGDRADWRDYTAPDDVKTGVVMLVLHVEHGVLAPFESTMQLIVDK